MKTALLILVTVIILLTAVAVGFLMLVSAVDTKLQNDFDSTDDPL